MQPLQKLQHFFDHLKDPGFRSVVIIVLILVVMILSFIGFAFNRIKTDAQARVATAQAVQQATDTASANTPVASSMATVTTEPETAVLPEEGQITPTPTLTLTTEATSEPVALPFGICLDDDERIDWSASIEIKRFNNFPRFSALCKNGPQRYFQTSSDTRSITIRVNKSELADANTMYLIANVVLDEDNLSAQTATPIAVSGEDNQYIQIADRTVASIYFGRKRNPDKTLIFGSDIGVFKIEDLQYIDDKVTFNPTYSRLWSGYLDKNYDAHQLSVVAIPIPGNINPFEEIIIEDFNSKFNLVLAGILFDNADETNIDVSMYDALCLDDQVAISIIGQAERRAFSAVVDQDRDDLGGALSQSCQLIEPKVPPHLYTRSLEQKPIPFVFWDEVVETKLSTPDDSIPAEEPKIIIEFLEKYTQIDEVKRIHIFYNIRNLCHPEGDVEINSDIIQVNITYIGGERTLFFNRAARNGVDAQNGVEGFRLSLRQGRSSTEGTCRGQDFRSLPNPERFNGWVDSTNPGTSLESWIQGTVLVAQRSNETSNKVVGLWVDILSIPLNGEIVKKIEIIDLSPPERSNDPSSEFPYSDPYFTIFGMLAERAEDE